MADCTATPPSSSGGEVTPLNAPIDDSVRVFWGKSVFVRGKRQYTNNDPLAWGIRGELDTFFLSPTRGYNRAYADEILRQGKKVGWWTTQGEMQPGNYQAAIARIIAISRPSEPFAINWELAPRWAAESDRLALYDILLAASVRNPIMISTLESYRWERHAVPHLAGHVVYAPEQYNLTNTSGDVATDTAHRESKRVQMASRWGGRDRIIPTVAGYGRSSEDMVTYLQTFSNEKGGIMWPVSSSTSRHQILKQWTVRT